MKRASALFNQESRERVAKAVGEAESRTRAEIVPVVATSSGRYDRAEDFFGVWLGLLAAAVVWFAFQDVRELDWGKTAYVIHPAWFILIVIGGTVLGAVLASRAAWVVRLLTPQREQQAEVERAAAQVFFDQRVHHTQGASGLLIYVSLVEHIALVLADREVTEQLGQEALDEVCAKLTAGLRKGSVPDALCAAIAEAGEKLAGKLPRKDGAVNELPDALVLVD